MTTALFDGPKAAKYLTVLKQEKYFPDIIDSKVFAAASAYFALGDPKNEKEGNQEKADKKGSMSKAEAKRLSEEAETVTDTTSSFFRARTPITFHSQVLHYSSLPSFQLRYVLCTAGFFLSKPPVSFY